MRDPALPAVCRELAAQTKAHFDAADAAMHQCIPTAMKPAKIMREYYGAIFDRLIENDWRDLSKRITLPKCKKLALMLKAFFS